MSAILGLAFGASASLLQVVQLLWIAPPGGVAASDQLVRLYFEQKLGSTTSIDDATSFVAYTAVRRHTQLFSDVAAFERMTDLPVGRGASGRKAVVEMASGNFFRVLGARPYLGRFFGEPEDQAPAGTHVVVLSYDSWRSTYNSDARALGRLVDIGGSPYTIIGVAPEYFTGVDVEPVQYWVPISAAAHHRVGPRWYQDPLSAWLSVIGRVRVPAADHAIRFTVDLQSAVPIPPGYPTSVRVWSAPLAGAKNRDGTPTKAATIAWGLTIIAVLLLLTACANASGLVLTNVLRRKREFAVRLSLGASRARIVGQLGFESLIFALGGLVVASAVYGFAFSLIRTHVLPEISWETSERPMHGLYAALAFVTLATTLIAAVIVSSLIGRDFEQTLRSRQADDGSIARVFQRALVGAQAMFALIVLTASAVLMVSLQHIRGTDVGFRPERLLLVTVNAGQRPSEEYTPIYQRVAESIAQLPGIRAAATAMAAPFTYTFPMRLRVAAADGLWDVAPQAVNGNGVSNDYFFVVGARPVSGRTFSAQDRAGSERVLVANRSLSELLRRRGIGLGGCVRIEADNDCTRLVGVVEDMRQNSLVARARPEFFVPQMQRPDITSAGTVLVSTNLDPRLLANVVKKAVLLTVPSALLVEVQPMEQLLEPFARPWQLGANISTAFALLALAIALAGVHGACSYYVATRRREIGIRSALGANSWAVGRHVLAPSAWMTVAGASAGVLTVLATAPMADVFLVGVSARDPGILLFSSFVVLGLSILGSLVPALTAVRADPALVMRAE